MERRTEKFRRQERKFQDMPDIVVKVVCKYRAELFFKISRKTKLSRLFNAWSERMEVGLADDGRHVNKGSKSDSHSRVTNVSIKKSGAVFVFTHKGRVVESTQTPEEIGLEDSDEILAVEMLDLTKPDHVSCPVVYDLPLFNMKKDYIPEPQRYAIEKHWTEDPAE